MGRVTCFLPLCGLFIRLAAPSDGGVLGQGVRRLQQTNRGFVDVFFPGGLDRTMSTEELVCLEELVIDVVDNTDWAEVPASGVDAYEGLGVVLGLGVLNCIPELLDPVDGGRG